MDEFLAAHGRKKLKLQTPWKVQKETPNKAIIWVQGLLTKVDSPGNGIRNSFNELKSAGNAGAATNKFLAAHDGEMAQLQATGEVQRKLLEKATARLQGRWNGEDSPRKRPRV
ncbi:hypothetical protein DPSP01_002730 [Paraphaeosphaeria sporulosa]